jgi:hypothetical protein
VGEGQGKKKEQPMDSQDSKTGAAGSFVRINSERQTEASRVNGSKSNGPKSIEGRNKVRLNAVRDGLYSNETVIEILGESREEFEELKDAFWNYFQPADAVTEMLVGELIATVRRRKRLRRVEATEIDNRLKAARMRQEIKRSDELKSLKDRLLELAIGLSHHRTDKPSERHSDKLKLEQVCLELASSSRGVEFLLEEMENVESAAYYDGELSEHQLLVLSSFLGISSWSATSFNMHNELAKKELRTMKEEEERESSAQDESEGTQPRKRKKGHRYFVKRCGWSRILSSEIHDVISELKTRKKMLTAAESAEAMTEAVGTILPADAFDRIGRAEAAIERRQYRALTMLLALRGDSSCATKVPELPPGSQFQVPAEIVPPRAKAKIAKQTRDGA